MWRTLLLCLLPLFSTNALSHAQGYPSRTIQILAGFPPGGSVDLVARIAAAGLTAELGQTAIVENKAGATGTLAANLAARSSPDGHTLLLVPGGHALYGATFKSLPFDPLASFEWIGNIVSIPFFLAVSAKSDIRSLPDLIAKAKAEPDKIKFGSVGPGSPHHLGVEMLARATGIKLLHVPYRGESPLLTGLIASDVDFAIFTPISVLGNVQSGTVRALAVTTKTRSSRLPDVATVEQALGLAQYDVGSWFALAGPAGIPQPVVERLNASLHKTVRSPDAIARLAGIGGEISPSSAVELRDRVTREQDMWNKIVEVAGVPKQ
jgi:tripartite-type tricarboxylate transporter receptor subunit TctC